MPPRKPAAPSVLSLIDAFSVISDPRSDRNQRHPLINIIVIAACGVLAGADNPAGARQVLDWLVSPEVQAALPDSMYVFPVVDGVELPEAWATFAQRPAEPKAVDPAEVAEQRDAWLQEWTEITTR